MTFTQTTPRPMAARQAGDDVAKLTVALVGIGAYSAAVPHAGGPSALPLLAVFAAAILASLAGFAFTALCGAFLFHLLPDPVRVVQLMMLCSIANQALTVWTIRRSIKPAAIGPLLLAALAGVPCGVALLTRLAPQAYLQVLGGLLAAWSLQQMLYKPKVRRTPSLRGDLAAGFLAGVLGGFVGFVGALIAVRCTMKGWSKERQRAVTQPITVIVQVVALALMTAIHPTAGGIGAGELAYVPVSLLGTMFGLAIFRRLNDRQFGTALNCGLAVSGFALVIG